MKPRTGIVFLLAVAIAGCSQPTSEGDAQPPSRIPIPRKEIRATRAEKAPVLDGRLDDDCWQAAERATGFWLINSEQFATYQSFAYICYDDAHLYIAMKCTKPKGSTPRGKPRPHDGNIFSDEVVEIMLDPGRTEENYYQLAVNAYGSTFDCARLSGGAHEDDSWDGEWKAASHIADEHWSVEAAIPFHNLGISPNVGAGWGINLCREAKNPAELSSIAIRGAFNNAEKFAVLTHLDADFSRYFFQIGPGKAIMDPTADKPTAAFVMPVTNLSGAAKTVRIDRYVAGADGTEEVASSVFSLSPGASVELDLEALPMAPLFTWRSDLYIIHAKPATKKIVVSDTETGTVLALALVRKLSLCEVMRIDVANPWRPYMTAEQTPAISLNVHTSLPDEELTAGELAVKLTVPGTGAVIAQQNFPQPSAVTSVIFKTERIPWGAYDVVAEFTEGSDRTVAWAAARASVLPGGKYHVEPLNNLVSELLNGRERQQLAERKIYFMNPRTGWCFFSLSGPAMAILDKEEKILLQSTRGAAPAEAMRFLPAGAHALRVEGEPEQIIVRAIPALIAYAFPTTPDVPDMGPYDMAFLAKPVFSNCNTIVSGARGGDELVEWVESGRKWIVNATVPGTHGVGGFAPADRVHKHWSSNPGFQMPMASGVIADEFASTSDEQYLAWTDALRRIAANPAFRGKTFYPWCTQVFGSDGTCTFMRTVVECGWAYSFYQYPPEQPTEAEAQDVIHDLFVKTARSCNTETFTSVRDAIVTMGYMSLPTESQNVNPNVDFKVFMDMQMHALANEPGLFGLNGLLWYSAHYCDEENIRWAARLFRHYAIEGNRERLTNDPYVTTHIQNGDFDDGTEGWAVTEAEPGSIRVEALPGYGILQGRYMTKRGDNVLVMRRSTKGVNSISQVIGDLQPGRAYSAKMISADCRNIIAEKSLKKKDAISIRIENADLIPGPRRNFQSTYANHPGHTRGKFKGAYHAFMNYHWYIFRAKGTSAKFIISDNAPNVPAAKVGDEVMFNFVEVQPYFLGDSE